MDVLSNDGEPVFHSNCAVKQTVTLKIVWNVTTGVLTLKIKALRSSRKSVAIYRSTWRGVPRDTNLQERRQKTRISCNTAKRLISSNST